MEVATALGARFAHNGKLITSNRKNGVSPAVTAVKFHFESISAVGHQHFPNLAMSYENRLAGEIMRGGDVL